LNTKLIKQIEEILGLSSYASQIYLELNKHKSLTAKKLENNFTFSKSEIISHLKELKTRGLIIEEIGQPVKYIALHPKLALSNIFHRFQKDRVSEIRQKRVYVENLTKSLINIYDKSQDSVFDSNVHFTTDENGFWLMLSKLVSDSQINHKLVLNDFLPPSNIFQLYEDSLNKGIKIQLILKKLDKLYSEQTESFLKLISCGLEIRNWKNFPMSFTLIDDKYLGILVQSDANEFTTLWIEDNLIVSNFVKNFKSLWITSLKNIDIKTKFGS